MNCTCNTIDYNIILFNTALSNIYTFVNCVRIIVRFIYINIFTLIFISWQHRVQTNLNDNLLWVKHIFYHFVLLCKHNFFLSTCTWILTIHYYLFIYLSIYNANFTHIICILKMIVWILGVLNKLFLIIYVINKTNIFKIFMFFKTIIDVYICIYIYVFKCIKII